MGRIAQDYTLGRGELSAGLGCERKHTSSFYFFIVSASASRVVASLKEGFSVFKVFKVQDPGLLSGEAVCWWEDMMLSECRTAVVR